MLFSNSLPVAPHPDVVVRPLAPLVLQGNQNADPRPVTTDDDKACRLQTRPPPNVPNPKPSPTEVTATCAESPEYNDHAPVRRYDQFQTSPDVVQTGQSVPKSAVARSRWVPTPDSDKQSIRIFQVQESNAAHFKTQQERAVKPSIRNANLITKLNTKPNIISQSKKKAMPVIFNPHQQNVSFKLGLTIKLLINKFIPQTPPPLSPVFRIFQVRNQGDPRLEEPISPKTSEYPPLPRDPRIDYESRDLARRARRRTTEDPLETKLREIFRSPEKPSKVIYNKNHLVHMTTYLQDNV